MLYHHMGFKEVEPEALSCEGLLGPLTTCIDEFYHHKPMIFFFFSLALQNENILIHNVSKQVNFLISHI